MSSTHESSGNDLSILEAFSITKFKPELYKQKQFYTIFLLANVLGNEKLILSTTNLKT